VQRDRLVERRGLVGVGEEERRLGAGHGDPRLEDHARQAVAADGGPEEGARRVVGRPARLQGEDPAVRDEQLHPGDVIAERPGRVVVLAVDVVPDRAADGDLARPRKHRYPQSERQSGPHELVQAHAGIDHGKGLLCVELVDAVEAAHVQHHAAGVLSAVAVRTAEAAGHHAAPQVIGAGGVGVVDRRDGGGDLLHRPRGEHVGGRSALCSPCRGYRPRAEDKRCGALA